MRSTGPDLCARLNCCKPAVGEPHGCCSSHKKRLCHRCYRLTHFVEICVEGCPECAAEKLPLILRWETSSAS